MISAALSMDAFAVAITIGVASEDTPVSLKQKSSLLPKRNGTKLMMGALIVGLYFGVFQAGMPLIGYALATNFAGSILAYDHWIAFVLLCFIGGRMFYEGLKKTGDDIGAPIKTSTDSEILNNKSPVTKKLRLNFTYIVPLACATSIDALAVGVSFAFLQISVIPAVIFIGFFTLILSMAGVKIGSLFGVRFKSKAELAGGVVLILIGFKILVEHIKPSFFG